MRTCCRLFVAALGIGWAGAALALDVTFDGRLEQGGLAVGMVAPGTKVILAGHDLPISPEGRFLIGFDRDAGSSAKITLVGADGTKDVHTLTVAKRQWEIEKVNGLPENLVTPDAPTLAHIIADNKAMAAARGQSGTTPFYRTGFLVPVTGRISGVFGSQRILNGQPRAPHVGLDIAAVVGTPVHAAADGRVILVVPDMVLTGMTIVLDHGFGLETNYFHMSALNVTLGQEVKQGDVIGAVGKTGRVTGPHMHFAVTWRDARLDPQTVLAVMPAGK